MDLLSADSTRSSQVLAATLLDAWLAGDRDRLLWELHRAAALPVSGHGAECDRMEILSSIAGEMQGDGDLFASRTVNTRIGVWMDLLSHLSNSEMALRN